MVVTRLLLLFYYIQANVMYYFEHDRMYYLNNFLVCFPVKYNSLHLTYLDSYNLMTLILCTVQPGVKVFYFFSRNCISYEKFQSLFFLFLISSKHSLDSYLSTDNDMTKNFKLQALL